MKLFNKTAGKEKREKVKRGKAEKIIIWIVFAVFAIYSVTLVFPFIWMLINSVKTPQNFISDIWGFSKTFEIQNYTDVLFKYTVNGTNVFGMFGISIVLTLCGTILSVIMSSMLAYILAKFKFFGRNLLFSIAIFVMVVPVVGTLPSQYRIMQTIGFLDGGAISQMLGLLVLYASAFGFNFFMMYGFFKNLSWGYAEAAKVDGANNFIIFIKIMIPLAKPALIAIAVIHSINLWNDYTTPSIYLKATTTLAVGLNDLVSQMTKAESQFPKAFATMIIALIPILAVFIAFQKMIMENTIAGGLKG